jgi:hypothetical protein
LVSAEQLDFFYRTHEHVVEIRVVDDVDVVDLVFVGFVDVKIYVKIRDQLGDEITVVDGVVVVFVVVVEYVDDVVVVVYAI